MWFDSGQLHFKCIKNVIIVIAFQKEIGIYFKAQKQLNANLNL